MEQLAFLQIFLIGLGLTVGLGLVVFWVWMLVDCLRHERVSGQDRLVWVVVIVLLKIVGAVLYYFMRHRPRHVPSVARG